jgi:ComF family protein
MKSFLSEAFDDFVALVYPHYCVSCQGPLVKGEDILCSFCICDLPRTNMHLDPSNALIDKFRGRIPVSAAAAFLKFRKRGNVQQILHALKYRNRPEIGHRLGFVYGHELRQAGFTGAFDLIVSVPLHPSRLRRRGYNQADEWAKGISDSSRIPFRADILNRIRNTETQTERTKLNRWENVREVFSVRNQESILGKRILLVDDVITTGATIEACGHVLLRAGCDSLGVACMAIAQ